MKYVCAKCSREMRPKKNEVYILEMASFGPYKLWMADLWGCHSCGSELIAGFAQNPLIEHYNPKFAEVLANIRSRRPIYEVGEIHSPPREKK